MGRLLEDVREENRVAMRMMSSVMTGIGLMALLLSLAGVYSIMSLSVTQRTREIGVWVALGAEPAVVLWSIVKRSGWLILFGAVLGSVLGTLALSSGGAHRLRVGSLGELDPSTSGSLDSAG